MTTVSFKRPYPDGINKIVMHPPPPPRWLCLLFLSGLRMQQGKPPYGTTIPLPKHFAVGNLHWIEDKKVMTVGCSNTGRVLSIDAEFQRRTFSQPFETGKGLLPVQSTRYVAAEDRLHVTYQHHSSSDLTSKSAVVLFDWESQECVFSQQYSSLFLSQIYDNHWMYNIYENGTIWIQHLDNTSRRRRDLWIQTGVSQIFKAVYIRDCALVLFDITGHMEIISLDKNNSHDGFVRWNASASSSSPSLHPSSPPVVLTENNNNLCHVADIIVWSQQNHFMKTFVAFADGTYRLLFFHMFPDSYVYRIVVDTTSSIFPENNHDVILKKLYRCSSLYGDDVLFGIIGEKQKRPFIMNRLVRLNVAQKPVKVDIFPHIDLNPLAKTIIFPAANVIVTDGYAQDSLVAYNIHPTTALPL